MATLEQLLAIARNTFFESIRQPVLLVVLVICTILVVLSNPFSAYTMTDDNKMFVDIGLSTVFIGGAILSAFIASNVITREIENRTVLTVVSKPVSRPVFIFGKYVGVCGAQVLAMLKLTVSVEETKALLKKYDTTGEGFVNYHNFCEFLQPPPPHINPWKTTVQA